MNGHPGGGAHTRRLLELAELPQGARLIDLGAGKGDAVRLACSMGFLAEGLDLEPRSELVEKGDLLHAPRPDGCFDAVLSQCAFYVSGDVPLALREARRLLKKGGKLLLSDVFFEEPEALLRDAGFQLILAENMTPAWREYYLEALWRGEDCPCAPTGKNCRYWLLIAQKGDENGSL